MVEKHYSWKLGAVPPDIAPHSLAKHRILAHYITRYIEILTRISQQEALNITFVDGYAGGGKYKYGKSFVDGSPLIALKAVAEMEAILNAQRPKGFRINANYYFIDSDSHTTEFLRSEIEKSEFKDQLDSSIHIWTDNFNNRVDDLVKAIKRRAPRSGRSIFLLDQYGWSQVAFVSIRKILEELNTSEVFLTFSVDALIDYLSENSYEMKAFGEIDADREFVKEILRIKQDEQGGARVLIQNYLYQHIQLATGAPFYSPFFIKSPDAHRSYWFIHLAKHREARNEIGMIHWKENNTSIHHGGAGLNALGFTPDADPEQLALGYLFDEHAKELSRMKLHEQLLHIIHESASSDNTPSLEDIFGMRCNDTPIVREILEESLIDLRREKEILIVDAQGKEKPRAKKVEWDDRIKLQQQRNFFGPFSRINKKEN